MAQVYGPPIEPPAWEQYEVDGKFSIDRMNEVEAAYEQSLRQWLQENGYSHQLTGELIRFAVGDGYAVYMIMNGQRIMHVPVGDAWQIPDAHARGLTTADLKEAVARRKSLEKLFSRPDAES